MVLTPRNGWMRSGCAADAGVKTTLLSVVQAPPPTHGAHRGGWLAACNVCRKKWENNSEEREEAGAGGVSNPIDTTIRMMLLLHLLRVGWRNHRILKIY